MANYLGLSTSLYPSLDPESIILLERAIWLKKIGRYEDALAIFKHDLASLKELPVILIEWSNLYLEHGRYGELYRLLEKPLQDRKHDQDVLDRPEWRLLALHRVLVMTRHKGILEPAIAELERTRQWLWDLPVSKYSDIHATCANRQLIVWLFVKLAMKFDAPELAMIPKPVQARIPWQGLTDLRISLIERGMIKEALHVYRVELNRTPLEKRSEMADEILGLLARLPDLHHRRSMEAGIKELYTDTLVELHNLPRAKEMAAECELALDQWCTENDIASKVDLPVYLNLQYDKLNFIADPLEKLEIIENISQHAEKTCHKVLTQLLNLAAETARKAATKTGSQGYIAKYYSFRERVEYENEYVQEDLCSLVAHRYDIQSTALYNLVDRQKELEWIDGFFAKYPDFQSPDTMIRLHRGRLLILSSLRDSEGVIEAQKMVEQWSKSAPTLRGLFNHSWANVVAPGNGAVGDATYDLEDEIDEGRSISELGRRHSGPEDLIKITQKLLHMLIDWAFEDVRSNSLESNVFQEIFDLKEGEVKEVCSNSSYPLQNDLKARDASALFRTLFLPKSGEDQSSDHRFQLLSNWLSNPPKGLRNIRLYWLVKFLETRSSHTLNSSFRDFDIADFERLLALQAKLPRLLKEYTESQIPFWYAGLSWRYILKFWSSGPWALFDYWDFALKAEEYSQKALDCYRQRNILGQIAAQQRLLATIYWCKIRRLLIFKLLSGRAALTDQDVKVYGKLSACISVEISIDDQMRQLREQGLQWLSEADDILSAGDREASWADGLDGIKKREEQAEQQQNYTTIQHSLQLLLAGPDPLTEEEIKTLWSLVQKYKNRLLAMAIGMHRPSPPGLVKKILSSKEVGPIYQEMIDLQSSIDKAEAKDRFHLRRQLDDHRKKMKQYQPLRQLINLREGTPIELSEIEDISAGIDVPVVLVDWIFVPAMIGQGQLLLLTARAGEMPTVDIIPINIQDVAAWITKCLSDPEGDEAPAIAKQYNRASFNEVCGSLVAPLASRTQEDELLVFSPTDFLHRLPLHALKVEGETLIHRNPIVYAHSHSLMRTCYLASQYAADSLGPINPQFISGIEAADERNYSSGRQNIRELAARFDSSPMIDDSASKSRFLEQAQYSRLLHMHTHCMWDSKNPLDHSLQFPSPPSSTMEESQQGGKAVQESEEQTRLTAREVFALRIQQGVHLNLIACSGGLTDIKAGDEVMGLVPAFLYSGAGSIVSTLWPIRDHIGARFSSGFFKAFEKQITRLREFEGEESDGEIEGEEDGDEGGNEDRNKEKRNIEWVNMAKAFRKAVRKLDPNQTEPLITWAGFVLHGFWMFCVDGREAEGMISG